MENQIDEFFQKPDHDYLMLLDLRRVADLSVESQGFPQR